MQFAYCKEGKFIAQLKKIKVLPKNKYESNSLRNHNWNFGWGQQKVEGTF